MSNSFYFFILLVILIGDSIFISRRIDNIEGEMEKLREAMDELEDEKISDIENRIDAIEERQGDDS